jgi:hypothetical protein
MLGIIGSTSVQTVAAVTLVTGLFLLFGQVLLVLDSTGKNTQLGWILGRLSYVVLFVMGLSLFAIAGGTFISSFQILGGNSSSAAGLFSSVGVTVVSSFGICLSAISFHTVSNEQVWLCTPNK